MKHVGLELVTSAIWVCTLSTKLPHRECKNVLMGWELIRLYNGIVHMKLKFNPDIVSFGKGVGMTTGANIELLPIPY